MKLDMTIAVAWVAGSARILITHQRQYLPQCDRVLVLRGGRVHAIGTPVELALMKLPELQATEGNDSARVTQTPAPAVMALQTLPDNVAETRSEPIKQNMRFSHGQGVLCG